MSLYKTGRVRKKLSVGTLLVAVFASSLALASTAVEDEVYRAWMATGINSQFVSSLVTTQACGADLKSFKGCIESVRVLAAANKLELTVHDSGIAFQAASDPAANKNSVQTAKEMYAEWAAYQAERRQENVFLGQIFSSVVTRHVALKAMVTYSQQLYQSLPEERAAKIGGEAYNAYLGQMYDPHTYIMPMKLFKKIYNEDGTQSAGIGADLLETSDDHYMLVPFENSPAQKAGIEPGDRLLAIAQQSIQGRDFRDIIRQLRGADGSQVTLEVQRPGQSGPVRVVVTRGVVQIPNVQSKMINQEGLRVGYIQLQGFMHKNSFVDLKNAVNRLRQDRAQGLVLDLRGNGGGNMDFAVQIASLFLPWGSLVVDVRSVPELETQSRLVTELPPVTNLPLVVLVDGYSASASELLAGALRDHKRAWLVGERTFGKGTVQNVNVHASMPDTVLAQTKAVFYQPNGQTNQLVGLRPDVEVPRRMGATEEERFVPREAELYANAINVDYEEYVHPRPQGLAKLKDQLGLHGRAEKEFSLDHADHRRDFQLLKALDVLRVSQ